MESLELKLVIRDGSAIQVRRQDGAEVSGVFLLDDLHRRMIEIYEYWIDQNKITRRQELEVLGIFLYKMIFNDRIESFFKQSLADARKAKRRLRIQLSF